MTLEGLTRGDRLTDLSGAKRSSSRAAPKLTRDSAAIGQVRTLPSDRFALPDGHCDTRLSHLQRCSGKADLSTFALQVDRLCCADFRQSGLVAA